MRGGAKFKDTQTDAEDLDARKAMRRSWLQEGMMTERRRRFESYLLYEIERKQWILLARAIERHIKVAAGLCATE